MQPRKEFLEVMGNQFLKGPGRDAAFQLIRKRGTPTPCGILILFRKTVVFGGLTGGHKKVEGEVGDKRKRVGRVYALGGQERVDLLVEIEVHFLLLRCAEFLIGAEGNAFLLQQFSQIVQDNPLLFQEFLGDDITGIDLLLRQHAVHRLFLDPGTHLLLEAADPFHEELIKVGTDNGNIKEAVKQRYAAVTGLGKHPAC